jgi:cyclic dehypoxanthinyl futalosine synthase
MEYRVDQIEEQVSAGQRIDRNTARWLWQHASDSDWQRLSGLVRRRYHAPGKATYLVMRIINYTNVCVAQCDYCAFYRLPRSPEGYLLPRQAIFEKIDELIEAGGDLVGFNGGFNPRLKIDYYADLFGAIRQRYEDRIEFYALTVVELLYIARNTGISALDAARILKDSGVRWVTGGGAEILSDGFRQRHSPQKYTVQEFFDAQRAIIEAGINTSGTMVIGFDESLEERLDHLDFTRQFQDETGALFSFLCWTYKPFNTALGGHELETGEYLRHLALCRVYLDNVQHLRTSVLTQNANALRGLRYGADDFDIPWEDEVTQTAGAVIERDVNRILGYAHAEGFQTEYRRVWRTGRAQASQPAGVGAR